MDRPKETVPYLVALNTLLHQTLRYQRRDESGIQPSLTTLRLGSGSCRDYAVLFIEICRTLGIAAVMLILAYILLPRILLGSAYADMRLAPYMMLVATIALSMSQMRDELLSIRSLLET